MGGRAPAPGGAPLSGAALPPFADLAAAAEPRLDLLALALAAEFRPVDAPAALAMLDDLGEDVARAVARTDRTPSGEADACRAVLAGAHGFAGESARYDEPRNSMLDLVLERRRGLPILLSVVYVEVARRAGVALAGIGLPGHFVVGHLGTDPPLLLDPFNGGVVLDADPPAEFLRPWLPSGIAMRMLNNLVPAFERRGNLAGALHAARLRLALPAPRDLREAVEAALAELEARLN